jgi:GTP-binding protein
VNLYRVDADRGTTVLYLADLPGYGHAGGGERTAREFDRLTAEYFSGQGPGARDGGSGIGGRRWIAGVILAIDARHPGLERDIAALRWLQAQSAPVALVATKFDKLTQAERVRTRRQMETSFGVAALPVSAATGEGLDQLWKTLLKWIRHN